MIRMGKVAITVGIVALVAIAGVGVAMYLNYLPNPLVSNVAAEYPGSTLLVADASFLSSMGVDASTVSMLGELNIEVYGIDNGCGSCVVSWYEDRNRRDGWSVVQEATADDSGTGWQSYVRGWEKGLMGQLIWVGEGTMVERYSGYDVIIITSTAPITTYAHFFA